MQVPTRTSGRRWGTAAYLNVRHINCIWHTRPLLKVVHAATAYCRTVCTDTVPGVHLKRRTSALCHLRLQVPVMQEQQQLSTAHQDVNAAAEERQEEDEELLNDLGPDAALTELEASAGEAAEAWAAAAQAAAAAAPDADPMVSAVAAVTSSDGGWVPTSLSSAAPLVAAAVAAASRPFPADAAADAPPSSLPQWHGAARSDTGSCELYGTGVRPTAAAVAAAVPPAAAEDGSAHAVAAADHRAGAAAAPQLQQHGGAPTAASAAVAAVPSLPSLSSDRMVDEWLSGLPELPSLRSLMMSS